MSTAVVRAKIEVPKAETGGVGADKRDKNPSQFVTPIRIEDTKDVMAFKIRVDCEIYTSLGAIQAYEGQLLVKLQNGRVYVIDEPMTVEERLYHEFTRHHLEHGR